MTDVEKTFLWNAHLQECELRQHDRRHSEEARATYSDVILPLWITGEYTKIHKLIGKRIHVWGLAALPLPQKLPIWKLGDIRAIRRPWADYSTKNDELRKDSSQEYNSSAPWIKHEIISLLQKLEWYAKEKNVKVYGMYTLVQKEDEHFLYNWKCTICCDNNASEAVLINIYKEIEESEQSNSLKTWAKCKELVLSFVRNARKNFGRQSPSHHHTPVYVGRLRCKKLTKKMEKKIVRKTTFASKGPHVTLRNTWGQKKSDVFGMPRETERLLQTWNFDRIASESRNWPDEDLQFQALHAKYWRIQVWCSAEADASFHCLNVRPSKRSKRIYIYILCRFSIASK